MRWFLCLLIFSTLMVGINAVPEANVPCPIKGMESIASLDSGYVQITDNTEAGALFDIPSGTGKLSVSMWLKMTASGAGLVSIFDLLGRPEKNGMRQDGDRIQLVWDAPAARLEISVTTSAVESTTKNSTTINGLGIVSLSSNRYRNIVLTVDASSGVITVAIDSVEMIRQTFPNVKNRGLNFAPVASLGYGASASGYGHPTTNSTLGNMTVFKGYILDVLEKEYLSQFQVPMESTANGCVAKPNSADIGFPHGGDIHTFFFYKTGDSFGFSFINSTVESGDLTIKESVFSLNVREVKTGVTLSKKSWTTDQESAKSCGAVQNATISFSATSLLVYHISMKFVFGTTPAAGTQFTIYNEVGESFGNFTTPLPDNTFSFICEGVPFVFSIAASANYGDFCIQNVNSFQKGNVLADPSVMYYELESAVSLYTGVREGYMGALVNPSFETCNSGWVGYEPLEFISTTTNNGYFTFTLKDQYPGNFRLCLYPTGAPAQKHLAGQCGELDTTDTFFCSLLLVNMPSNAIPLQPGWVTDFLHLGDSFYTRLPLRGMNADPFIDTGGESVQEPEFGDTLHLDDIRYLWYPIHSEDGRFAQNNKSLPSFWVQYFALAIYNPVVQDTVITLRYNTSVRVYVDGNIVFEDSPSFPEIGHSSSFSLSEGWHQILVKVAFLSLLRMDPEMSLRFDHARSLSWNYVKPLSQTSTCDTGNRSNPCLGSINATVSHQQCVELGCCYEEHNPVKCFSPSSPRRYRVDAKCGPGVALESANLDVAECNPHSCCSSGFCGQSYANCTCTTCVDYNFLEYPRGQYIDWGTRAMCYGSRDLNIGQHTKEICQLRCDREDGCVAFSLGEMSNDGLAECYLSFGTCNETVVDVDVSKTYRRLNESCAMTAPEDAICEDADLTLYGESIARESCFHACSMTSRCDSAVYTDSQQCSFSTINCKANASTHSVVSRFRCKYHDAKPPTPHPAVPPVPIVTYLGCYQDADKNYFVKGAENRTNNQYPDNIAVISDGDSVACSMHCASVGTLYFAVTDGTICTCGVFNNESLRESDQSRCSKVCQNGTACGGITSASVYKINSYVGICPQSYSYFEGLCFKLVDHPSTWNESVNSCAAEGSFLVGVSNSLVNQYILSLAEGQGVWLGGYRTGGSSSGNAFSWINGEPFSFVDWLPGEPNNGGGNGNTEDCILALPNHPTPYVGSWMDAVCTTKHSFVCMSSATANSPLTFFTMQETWTQEVYCLPEVDGEKSIDANTLGRYLLHHAEYSNGVFNDKSDRPVNVQPSSTESISWESGIKDTQTLKFDGSFYLQATKVLSLRTHTLSVAMWMKVGEVNTSRKVLISKSFSKTITATDPLFVWALAFDEEGHICFYVGIYKACGTNMVIYSGIWYHLAGVFDSSTVNMYVDGEVVGTTLAPEAAIVPNNETYLVIGGEYRAHVTNANNFVGIMDDVRVYNSSLSRNVLMYLSSCNTVKSLGNKMPIYAMTASIVEVVGRGLSRNSAITVSPKACAMGDKVVYPKISPGIFTVDRVYFFFQPTMLLSSFTGSLHICSVNSINKNLIDRDLNMHISVVYIRSINNISSSRSMIQVDENTVFPLTLQIRGSNIAEGQYLYLAERPCRNFFATLPIRNVQTVHSELSAEVVLPMAPMTPKLYFCWAKSNTSIAYSTPFWIRSIISATHVASVAGSKQITVSTVHNGFFESDSSFFNPCTAYGSLGDRFYAVVAMGFYNDILIPYTSTTVCDLLSSSGNRSYAYSPYAPTDSRFSAHLHDVPFTRDLVGGLGGSPAGFPASEKRFRLSFWGDNIHSTNLGGCCQGSEEDIPSWGRAYNIFIYSANESHVWMDWEHPRAAAAGSFLYFRVSLKNFRGEVLQGKRRFLFDLNNEEFTMESDDSGILEFMHRTTFAQGTGLELSLQIEDTLVLQNGNKQTRSVVVGSPIPTPGLLLDSTRPLPLFLRLGGENAGCDVSFSDAYNYDWIQGSESVIQPYEGMETSTYCDQVLKWEKAFVGTQNTFIVNKGLHFFSVGVYVTDTMLITLISSGEAYTVVYIDGKLALTYFTYHSKAQLSPGWHQFLIKLWSPSDGASMNLRVIASGAGWFDNIPTSFPSGVTFLTDGEPISMALSLGGEGEYIYGSFDWYLVEDMRTLRPHNGDVSITNLVWQRMQVSEGNWKVDGTRQNNTFYALRYFAFALFAGMSGDVRWKVQCAGPAEVWVNGAVLFRCPFSSTPEILDWYQSIEFPGWYQIIVEIGAAPRKAWYFSMTPVVTNHKMGIAYEVGSYLPPGAALIKQGQPVADMLIFESMMGHSVYLSEIPNGVEGTGETDFDINVTISNGNPVNVSIYNQKSVEFDWWPQRRYDGVFGSLIDSIAGGYNQYYSFAVYAPFDMNATMAVEMTGPVSVFLDSKPIYTNGYTSLASIPFDLTYGWHRFVFKLSSSDEFFWIPDTSNGTLSWSSAQRNCQTIGFAQTCNRDALCPYDLKRDSLGPFKDSTFVPFVKPTKVASHDYLQTYEKGGNGTSVCESWSETHDNNVPAWANTDDKIQERRGYACCGLADGTKFVAWFTYQFGELGFSTQIPQYVLDLPTASVDNPLAEEQMVKLTHIDKDVVMYYALSFVEGWLTYHVPFPVNQTSFIRFYATKGSEKSDTGYIFVTIPTTVTLYRDSCPETLTCLVETGGTTPTRHMAFAWENVHNMDSYKNYWNASQITPDLRTTGVIPVFYNIYSYVSLSNLSPGTYIGFYYQYDWNSTKLSQMLQIKPLKLTPTFLIGNQDTTLNVDGLEPRDALLLLDLFAPKPVCTIASCTSAFMQNHDMVAFVDAGHKATFDLYRYEGNLTCLCACVVGSSSPYGTHRFFCDFNFMNPVPIDIQVILPPNPVNDTVQHISPLQPRDGEDVIFEGYFSGASTVEYNVILSPGMESNVVRNPTCLVKSVNTTKLLCTLSVPVGTFGNWTAVIYRLNKEITNDGASNVLTCVPPPLFISGAFGDCASRSSACVDGALLHLTGSNFNTIEAWRNIVSLTALPNQEREKGMNFMIYSDLDVNPTVSCVTEKATETVLTCRLRDVELSPPHSRYNVTMMMALTRDFRTSYPTNQSLLLRGGAEPGWSGVVDPQPGPVPVPGNGSNSSTRTIIVVCVVFGLAIVLLVTVGIFVKCRYSLVPKREGEEEMSYMEEQLLRAERESTASLKRTMLNAPIPPIQEGAIPAKQSLNDL